MKRAIHRRTALKRRQRKRSDESVGTMRNVPSRPMQRCHRRTLFHALAHDCQRIVRFAGVTHGCDRIDAFAYKIACGSGRPSCINECDIGVGAETEEVLLARAWPSLAEQPCLCTPRLDPQGEPISICEKVGTGACFGGTERQLRLRYGASGHRFAPPTLVYAKFADVSGSRGIRREQKTP